MSENMNLNEKNVKMTRFPMSVYWFVLGACLLVSGVHMGIIVLFNKLNIPSIILVHVVLIYWALAAFLIVIYIRKKVSKTIEEPLQKIALATHDIAKGDFSIYIEPTHTPDRLDYIDTLIININKMVEELGSIETLKTDFISNVSHEMKTPIAVIKNTSQLLKKEDLGAEEKSEYLNMIDRAATRLSSLITNILKLNKLENQKIIPSAEKYDVCRQLTDCIIQFDNRFEEKNIELEVDIEDEAFSYGDTELMELVWNNLLSNAVKFTEINGTIEIKEYTEGDRIYVSVSDNGCGMSEETLHRIFDKFYQGDTSHSTEGNGLGLALAYRVVSLMGGQIKVTSKEGVGSTFTVNIPAHK